MEKRLFEKLIDSEGKRIYNFCRCLCADRDEADELFQNTVLKALELGGRLELVDSPESFKRTANYCMGIAIRLNRKMQGKKLKSAEAFSLDDEESLNPDLASEENLLEDAVKKDEILRLRKAVAELPYKFRIVIYLYYYARLDTEEIAKLQKIPRGTVKSRLFKAREKIREKMED